LDETDKLVKTEYSTDGERDGQEEKEEKEEKEEWSRKVRYLFTSFLSSSAILFTSYFFPILGSLPIMSWIGLPSLTMFSWTLTPSLSYVGQGMIMGPKTGISMMLGALFGWGILAPVARHEGWAPGPVDNWKTGAKGWIMWVSLAIMLGESISSLSIIAVQAARSFYEARKRRIDRERYGVEKEGEEEEEVDPAPPEQQVPRRWWVTGLIASTLLCLCTVSPLFNMPFYEPLIAVAVACLTSVLAVRALGETDLNPVSGIGKISQIVFAGVAPGNVVANLIAGAISEAGAQQAGDLMQDLKTGHLLRASPRAQFFAQLIGSFFSVFFAVAAYQLYSAAYTIPGVELPAPTAAIWIDMAELVNGGHLPEKVGHFCLAFALIAALFPLAIAFFPKMESYLPSCVAFAVAMYVTPNWTIARVIGSAVDFAWKKYSPQSHEKYMIIVASGFVLGEGITSILTAIMKTLNVPTVS
jgi:OPT family oligopeptide transporter